MATVLVCGVGGLGGWALELLVRSPGIDRVVTMSRSEGSTVASLASLGAVFQSRLVQCDHVVGDVTDVDRTARVLEEVSPDVIVSSVTMRSPRALMAFDIDPDVRTILRRATFGMWLPWHLLPVTRLTEAAIAAGSTAPIVNAAFPDVVNPALWKRYGYGPRTGAGNGEVVAVKLKHHVASAWGVALSDVDLAVVGSHAFFMDGTEVPHWVRVWVRGEDVTASIDVGAVVTAHPQPIDWRATSTFSIFAASAVKNALGLLSSEPWLTHVTAPNGLPGSYPARISTEGVELALPSGLEEAEAVRIAEAGNAHDGIEAIESDGSVVFTPATTAAMDELGYDGARVRFDELEERIGQLDDLFARITT